MLEMEERNAQLKNMITSRGARGVIYASLKFCDTYIYDYPQLKRFLDGEGIPVLRLESDYQDGHAGQLSTRIEAFVEMLEEAPVVSY
jgi:benzoyl-CoA reductase/2-hydroxyglutaryl-CoA dehydratase subunit BcrC/BadD/HgdB